MIEKVIAVFPPDGQRISDNHRNFLINKFDVVDANNVFLMYANEMVGGKLFQELLKALSYSKGTVICELKAYIVLLRSRVNNHLF